MQNLHDYSVGSNSGSIHVRVNRLGVALEEQPTTFEF